jgi:hypothetical protein
MKLFKMESGKPQCLLYAAAMLLDVPPLRLIEEIGHDGLRSAWPQLNAPLCYTSHHIQEIIDCFVARGLGLMNIEFDPHIASAPTVPERRVFKEYEARFQHHLEDNDAIIIGQYKDGSLRHACAWDHVTQTCYDPNGYLGNLADYRIMEAWLKVKMI